MCVRDRERTYNSASRCCRLTAGRLPILRDVGDDMDLSLLWAGCVLLELGAVGVCWGVAVCRRPGQEDVYVTVQLVLTTSKYVEKDDDLMINPCPFRDARLVLSGAAT